MFYLRSTPHWPIKSAGHDVNSSRAWTAKSTTARWRHDYILHTALAHVRKQMLVCLLYVVGDGT